MITESINKLIGSQSLTLEECVSVMDAIMEGKVTDTQLSAFLVALKIKGPTSDEIAGLAVAMRNKSLQIQLDYPLVDTCGTGGDGQNTFNISTASIFICAAMGLKIAKHGNRAASGSCGSADVLEGLGINIELQPNQVSKCIEDIGIGFMFAPIFHPAMKYAGPVRRELGFPTVFNILGPLTNPAHATHQLLGIADPLIGEQMAQSLIKTGVQKAIVVHGTSDDGGVDEFSLAGTNLLWSINNGKVIKSEIHPDDLKMANVPLSVIKGGDKAFNAELIQKILSGEQIPHRDVLVANCGLIALMCDLVSSVTEGIEMAEYTIDSGGAKDKFLKFKEITNSLR
jgi:anthranilate phosphoribosyltransferase